MGHPIFRFIYKEIPMDPPLEGGIPLDGLIITGTESIPISGDAPGHDIVLQDGEIPGGIVLGGSLHPKEVDGGIVLHMIYTIPVLNFEQVNSIRSPWERHTGPITLDTIRNGSRITYEVIIWQTTN